MIQPISDNAPAVATAATPKEASSANTVKTSFGEVLVSELSTPNLAALFGGHAAASATSGAATEANVTPNVPLAEADAGKATADPSNGRNAAGGPTAESIFGADVFVANPCGHGPNATFWNYNPIYFATRQTADVLAKMLGGRVVERNAICPSGPMLQDQVNRMILLPDGREVNAGLVADIFNHGRSQAVVDQMLKEEVAGAPRVEGVE